MTQRCVPQHVPEHVVGWRKHGLSQLQLLDGSSCLTIVSWDKACDKHWPADARQLLKRTNAEAGALARARQGLLICYDVVLQSYGGSTDLGRMLQCHAEALVVDMALSADEADVARKCAGAHVDVDTLEQCEVALLYARSYIGYINSRARSLYELLTAQQRHFATQGGFRSVMRQTADTIFQDARVLLSLEFERLQQAAALLIAVSPTGGEDVVADGLMCEAAIKKQRVTRVTVHDTLNDDLTEDDNTVRVAIPIEQRRLSNSAATFSCTLLSALSALDFYAQEADARQERPCSDMDVCSTTSALATVSTSVSVAVASVPATASTELFVRAADAEGDFPADRRDSSRAAARESLRAASKKQPQRTSVGGT